VSEPLDCWKTAGPKFNLECEGFEGGIKYLSNGRNHLSYKNVEKKILIEILPETLNAEIFPRKDAR
jgi:hypothetical protein